MKNFLFILIILISFTTQAREKIDSLGGNKDLLKRARALDPNNKTRIVQKRAVDRNLRFELGFTYGAFTGGGDPYVNTSAMGASADLHLTPRWSIGARYYDHRNELTSEGRRAYDQAKNNQAVDANWQRVDIDYPDSTTLGVISFYPLYGKLNLFDMGVSQFDIYMLAGYGQMELSSGSTEAWTAGGGVGLWLSQHFSSRLEVRYQGYQDEISTGTRDQGVVVSTFSVGILL